MIKNIRRSSTIALLLSPVGVLIIAAARLLIIANYNMNSTLAILTSAGYVNTLLGTVFPIIPAFLPYLALALVYLNRVIASCLAFVATVLISPATMSRRGAQTLLLHEWHVIIGEASWRRAVLIVLAIPTVCLLLWVLAGFGPKFAVRAIGTISIIVLLPLIVDLYPAPLSQRFYTDILRQPWLPGEAITLRTHQTVTVYKLDDNDGVWLEALRADDRSVAYYNLTTISARQLCQVTSSNSMRPIVALVAGSSGPRPCNSLVGENLNENLNHQPWTRSSAGMVAGQVPNIFPDSVIRPASGKDK